ncbi:hypothetical protein Mevan_1642 [Methanococcus vannielii SB]|uniref:Uncharacterized protein n=1 Tax=Methanococcus vannielii (strain ATCC 35089 / DSM 1224 / JCM 13029 / OCM 148 / SB) TaxID=406327 RepID=A6USR2_METVS|nr:hypothetical protein [Methanococcus vannielii]ABR55534.1 hypothetical protein Mevan_1642 [Methanococcus vannielii SB]
MHGGEDSLDYTDYMPISLDSFGSKYKKDIPKGVEWDYSAGMYWWSINKGKKSSEILKQIGDRTQKKEMFEILDIIGIPTDEKSWKFGCFKVLRNEDGYTLDVYGGEEYISEDKLAGKLEKIS